MYSRVLALRLKNPALKVLLAVGGWNLGSGPFSDMAFNRTTRARFVNTTVKYLTDNGFNGLDLDWVGFNLSSI